MELLEKLAQPAALSNSMGDNMILCFSTGVRDSVLSLGEPGYQVIAEEDAEAGGGATHVRAAHPVSVRVGGELANRSGA
jgi:hypothetical protein